MNETWKPSRAGDNLIWQPNLTFFPAFVLAKRLTSSSSAAGNFGIHFCGTSTAQVPQVQAEECFFFCFLLEIKKEINCKKNPEFFLKKIPFDTNFLRRHFGVQRHFRLRLQQVFVLHLQKLQTSVQKLS